MLYAEIPSQRSRQLLTDGAALAWAALWVRAGMWTAELVGRLAGPARAIERAGGDFAHPFEAAGRRVADVPVIGDALGVAFRGAANAGHTLSGAGSSQAEVVHTLALWLGLFVAALPIALVAARYLPARVRWIRSANVARRLRDGAGLELFALRAVANRPLHELWRACPDPAGALAAGDHEPLARLELTALGLEVDARGRGRA
jgi:hypothetical protein